MFGEMTSQNVYLIQNYKHNQLVLLSDLLYVEKTLRWETRLSLHIKKHLCFNHISLLKQWLVAYKVGLYIKVIYYMYKLVQYTRLACTCNL